MLRFGRTTESNKKLLGTSALLVVTSATLLGARTLLGAFLRRTTSNGSCRLSRLAGHITALGGGRRYSWTPTTSCR